MADLEAEQFAENERCPDCGESAHPHRTGPEIPPATKEQVEAVWAAGDKARDANRARKALQRAMLNLQRVQQSDGTMSASNDATSATEGNS